MMRKLKCRVQKCFFGIAERIAFQAYDPRCHAVRELHVPPTALGCFSLSANNIKLVHTEQGVAYFREMICRTPLPAYLSSLIEDYLLLLHNGGQVDNFAQEIPIEIQFPGEIVEMFEAYMRLCQQKTDFYARLSRMNEIVERSGYSIWHPETRLTTEMLTECGLTDFPETLLRVFPHFITFIKSGLEQYRRSSLAGFGGMDAFNACRSLATKIVADALGLGRLIPSTEVVQVCASDKRMFGVLCARCLGMRAKDAPWEPAPSLQRDLADMQVLDALCYHNDHWVNNYNVYERDGVAVGAMAFDNDNLWAFFPTWRISFASAGGGSPLLSKNGLIRLPHLSAETARRVATCDAQVLSRLLSPYLNRWQRVALRMRLRALQRALRRTEAARPDFLLADEEWTAQTLQQELCGECGHTYTYLYATTRDCCSGTRSRTRTAQGVKKTSQ